jgi:hypothetical protein
MWEFELDLAGTKFPVPRKALFNFFDHHREFMDAKSYTVQSPVPLAVFGEFANFLATGVKLTVTPENFTPLSSLADEFHINDLRDECARIAPGAIVVLTERLSKLESQVSSSSAYATCLTDDQIGSQECQLENHDHRLARLEADFELLYSHVAGLDADRLPLPPPAVELIPDVGPLEFPLPNPKSCAGILSYLTRKYRGNVHTRGTVIITAKSVASPENAVENIADHGSDTFFMSMIDLNQWFCLDFQEMRVHPSHYTMKGSMKSWKVESSLDGEKWSEIDVRKNNNDKQAGGSSQMPGKTDNSFSVSKATECRFIRVMLTDVNQLGRHFLGCTAFEVFGTLTEQVEDES